MRAQVRPPVPDVLEENADKWNKQWTELRNRRPNAQFHWYTVGHKNARDWILPTLRRMNQAHCSFCDTFPLDDRSSEPIEHFRPKTDSRFTMLAYEWSNLYYCCELCQKSKVEQWDDLLLCPDAADYAFGRYFSFDFTTGEIRPNPKASEAEQERAAITIKIYGLDLDSKRRRRREQLRHWHRSVDREIDTFAYRDFIEYSEIT